MWITKKPTDSTTCVRSDGARFGHWLQIAETCGPQDLPEELLKTKRKLDAAGWSVVLRDMFHCMQWIFVREFDSNKVWSMFVSCKFECLFSQCAFCIC